MWSFLGVLSFCLGGGTSVWPPRAICLLPLAPSLPWDASRVHSGLTFFLMMPVSPLSRRLDSFSSRSFLSYLVLMSWISLSSSSSICFLVSSNSRSCCRTSSCACLGGREEGRERAGRWGWGAVLRGPGMVRAQDPFFLFFFSCLMTLFFLIN